MSEKELANILMKIYKNAPPRDKQTIVRLFGLHCAAKAAGNADGQTTAAEMPQLNFAAVAEITPHGEIARINNLAEN